MIIFDRAQTTAEHPNCSVKTEAYIQKWTRAVCDSKMSAGAKSYCLILASYMYNNSKTATVSQKQLASDLARSIFSVLKYQKMAVSAGYVRVDVRGFREGPVENRYHPMFPKSRAQASTAPAIGSLQGSSSPVGK